MKIFLFWYQGYRNSPPYVKTIMRIWQELNPSCELIFHDRKSVRRIVSQYSMFENDLSHQVFANMLRMLLVRNEGGVWVDTTLLPTVSLDKLGNFHDMTIQFGAPERPKKGVPFSNWFIYSKPDSYITNTWIDAYNSFFRNPRRIVSRKGNLADLIHFLLLRMVDTNLLFSEYSNKGYYPYLAAHYLFKFLIENDNKFNEEWQKSWKIDSRACHGMHRSLQHGKSVDLDGMFFLNKLSSKSKYNINEVVQDYGRYITNCDLS